MDFDDGVSHTVPIDDRHAFLQATLRDLVGGDCTEYMMKTLTMHDFSFTTTAECERVEGVMEKLSCILLHYNEGIREANGSGDIEKTCEPPDGDRTSADDERFRFKAGPQPSPIGQEVCGNYDTFLQPVMGGDANIKNDSHVNVALSWRTRDDSRDFEEDARRSEGRVAHQQSSELHSTADGLLQPDSLAKECFTAGREAFADVVLEITEALEIFGWSRTSLLSFARVHKSIICHTCEECDPRQFRTFESRYALFDERPPRRLRERKFRGMGFAICLSPSWAWARINFVARHIEQPSRVPEVRGVIRSVVSPYYRHWRNLVSWYVSCSR